MLVATARFSLVFARGGIMGNDKHFSETNFNPSCGEEKMEALFASIAEQSIVRTTVEGSGGPNNEEITEDGLRFIRYLLSISRSTRFGFIPNFKDMDTIHELARQFIRYCGGSGIALQTLNRVVDVEAA
jgi:hypothetical protein